MWSTLYALMKVARCSSTMPSLWRVAYEGGTCMSLWSFCLCCCLKIWLRFLSSRNMEVAVVIGETNLSTTGALLMVRIRRRSLCWRYGKFSRLVRSTAFSSTVRRPVRSFTSSSCETEYTWRSRRIFLSPLVRGKTLLKFECPTIAAACQNSREVSYVAILCAHYQRAFFISDSLLVRFLIQYPIVR